MFFGPDGKFIRFVEITLKVIFVVAVIAALILAGSSAWGFS